LLLTALFAGQHTSNITASWVGLLLARNPQYIPRLREEQDRVLSKHNGELTMAALGEMDFLHACVREALRLFPPLIFLMRYVRKAREYAGYTIPEGDIVW
jgi:sterol 14alpha-demethylase